MTALFIFSHLYRVITQPKINNSIGDEIFLGGCFVIGILLISFIIVLIAEARDRYRARCRDRAEAQVGMHITKLLILVSFLFVSHAHAQSIQTPTTAPKSLLPYPKSEETLVKSDPAANTMSWLTRKQALELLFESDPNLNAFSKLTIHSKHYPTIDRRGDEWVVTFPKD